MVLPVSTSYFIGVSVFLLLVMFGWLAYLTFSVRKFRKHQERVKRLAEEGNLASTITNSLEQVDSLKKELEQLNDRQDLFKELAAEAVQKVGLVRFNAFNDLGGELSFAAALLNDNGDGLVISSIYGAGESRSYAKLIKGKKSSYRLSREEEQAIAEAFNKNASK